MSLELTDYVHLDGTIFPKNATREELESIGARYLKTDNFLVEDVKRNIEYMVLKRDGILVWKKFGEEPNYALHFFATQIVKFT